MGKYTGYSEMIEMWKVQVTIICCGDTMSKSGKLCWFNINVIIACLQYIIHLEVFTWDLRCYLHPQVNKDPWKWHHPLCYSETPVPVHASALIISKDFNWKKNAQQHSTGGTEVTTIVIPSHMIAGLLLLSSFCCPSCSKVIFLWGWLNVSDSDSDNVRWFLGS